MTENTTSKSLYEDLQPVQGVILGLIASPGIIANIFAMVVTVKLLRQQSLSPNVFVFALACMDCFGIIVVCTPTWLCYIFGHWVGGDQMCKFQGFMTLLCTLGTGFIATSMSVDRFIAVKWPLHHRQRVTVKVVKRLILGLVITAGTVASFPVLGFGSFVLNLTGTYCTLNWFAKDKEDVAFSYMYAVIGMTLVVTVIFCNINIVVKLCKREDKLRGMSRKSDKQQTSRTLEKQFTKMMIVISLMFLICWTPFVIRIISNLAGVWISWSADLQASRLLLLNLVLDPFTYVLTRQHYRNALRDLCCLCRKKKRRTGFKGQSSLTSSSRNIRLTNSSNVLDVIDTKEEMNKEQEGKPLNSSDAGEEALV